MKKKNIKTVVFSPKESELLLILLLPQLANAGYFKSWPKFLKVYKRMLKSSQ